ncbi:hemophore-related protein [Mycobacteroides abscessus]|uniref:hemophore-related protein n=1 Tax=Mycobacteroides abscessus TaxID=36809 RepID=UPI001927ED07|nr:hemophore-related protein [Mycobacteroides abscessus]MBL3737026.1 hemophore-related protein [Mycobacteroides abscessus subsp. massiliense]
MSATTSRRAAYGLLSAGVLAGGLALSALAPIAAAEPVPPTPVANAAAPAAATVTPATPTPDGCQASKMTKTVGNVVQNAASYLEQHPDVDAAFTEIKAAPQDQIATKTQSYLVSRPDVAASLGGIAAPLNELRTKCGLPLDLAQVVNGGGLNPAAMGVNPALLTALSQNPAAQQVAQNPAAQALVQNPAVQAAIQNPAPAATFPQGPGPAPGPVQPVQPAAPAGPVGTGPAPGPRV